MISYIKDLVREILQAVEASNEDPLGWTELSLEGREALDVPTMSCCCTKLD